MALVETRKKMMNFFEQNNSDKIVVNNLSIMGFNCIIPSLSRLQSLVYAVYTADGNPRRVSEVFNGASTNFNTAYLIATHQNLDPFFRIDPNKELQTIEQELRQYKLVGGFLRVEWGEHIPQVNHPIEGMRLIKWTGWPEGTLGYVGAFTVNPLLPRDIRLNIQKKLHDQLYVLAAQHSFSERIFTILQTHVVKFVQDSQLRVEETNGATPNWENPEARGVFETWPKYWEPPPKLYRFIAT